MVEHRATEQSTWASVVKEDLTLADQRRDKTKTQSQDPHHGEGIRRTKRTTESEKKISKDQVDINAKYDDIDVVRDRAVVEEVHSHRDVKRVERPIVNEYREQPIIEVREHPEQKRIVHEQRHVSTREPTKYEEVGNKKSFEEAERTLQQELKQHSTKHIHEPDVVHKVQEEPEVHVHTRRHIEVHERPIIYEEHVQPIEEIVEKPIVRVVHEEPITRVIRDETKTKLPDFLPHERHFPRQSAADMAIHGKTSNWEERGKSVGRVLQKGEEEAKTAVKKMKKGAERVMDATSQVIDQGVTAGEKLIDKAEDVLAKGADIVEEQLEGVGEEISYEYEHGIRWFDPHLWAVIGFFGAFVFAHATASHRLP